MAFVNRKAKLHLLNIFQLRLNKKFVEYDGKTVGDIISKFLNEHKSELDDELLDKNRTEFNPQILILLNGIVIAAVGSLFAVIPGMAGLGLAIAAVGLIFGIIVLIGTWMMMKPGKETAGGIIVLIFSILSIIIGGGFLIGMILGIVGGALALAKK